MDPLFRLSGTVRRDPAIERWLAAQPGEMGAIARRWFEVMRHGGDDVRELLHDGHPTACVEGAAFCYVAVFKAHVNVGFFRGAELDDAQGLLEGTGKLGRHVKLRPGAAEKTGTLARLIEAAYVDVRRLAHEEMRRARVFPPAE